jgi:hypothetical protein
LNSTVGVETPVQGVGVPVAPGAWDMAVPVSARLPGASTLPASGVGEGLDTTVLVCVSEGVWDGFGVRDGVGEAVRVAEAVQVGVRVAVGDAVSVKVAVGRRVSVGMAV